MVCISIASILQQFQIVLKQLCNSCTALAKQDQLKGIEFTYMQKIILHTFKTIINKLILFFQKNKAIGISSAIFVFCASASAQLQCGDVLGRVDGFDQGSVLFVQSLHSPSARLNAVLNAKLMSRYWDSAEAKTIAEMMLKSLKSNSSGIEFQTSDISGDLRAYIDFPFQAERAPQKTLTLNFRDVRIRDSASGKFLEDGGRDKHLTSHFAKIMVGVIRALYEVRQEHLDLEKIVIHSNVANPRLASSLAELGFSQTESQTGEGKKYWFLRGDWDVPPPFQDLSPASVSGRALVSSVEEKVQKFFATTGFPNRNIFLNAVRTSGPVSFRALEMVNQENFEIAMAVPDSVRMNLTQTGFLNIRQVDKSQGGVSRGRDAVEAGYLGIDVESYEKMDPAIKMKAAYWSPTPDSGLQPSAVAKMFYGEDRFIFKIENIRDRMTWTPGDSFNRRHYWKEDAEQTEWDSWDQFFIPWKHRDLAVPFLLSALENGKWGTYMSTFTASPYVIDHEYPSGAKRHLIQLTEAAHEHQPVLWTSTSNPPLQLPTQLAAFKNSWGTHYDYIEAQIWGKLTLDDVKIFEFTTKPPSGDFLQELLKRGIVIRDGRSWPAVPWVP